MTHSRQIYRLNKQKKPLALEAIVQKQECDRRTRSFFCLQWRRKAKCLQVPSIKPSQTTFASIQLNIKCQSFGIRETCIEYDSVFASKHKKEPTEEMMCSHVLLHRSRVRGRSNLPKETRNLYGLLGSGHNQSGTGLRDWLTCTAV